MVDHHKVTEAILTLDYEPEKVEERSRGIRDEYMQYMGAILSTKRFIINENTEDGRNTIIRTSLKIFDKIQFQRETDPDKNQDHVCFDCVDFLPTTPEIEKNREKLQDLASKISIPYINAVESSGGLDRYC